MNIIQSMFDSGVFVQKYYGIIEIYPHKAMNSYIYNAALRELNKNYKLYKITDNWLRAFKKE
jgi:hypothetical protein